MIKPEFCRFVSLLVFSSFGICARCVLSKKQEMCIKLKNSLKKCADRKKTHSFFVISMDFEEFLWAKGYDDAFIKDMLEHMRNLTPFNEVQMFVCSSLFLDYCILGGMPAVVREFIVKGTFEGSLEVQRQLIADYKEDIRKYAEGIDQTRILNVFNHIPAQLAKDNKKL